ncbi:lysylphosphatidylglycerol synthase transmembrane domain-containing protein [Actinotalea fermentans]|uniref:lysylphosphatidylglycerol synthase transmembrane domain-containing protein n=1 Tax=Actinotalea fermentans TaxID=43671 RepID=UPI0011BF79C6|nr:lysylphosphatidylglycerol synthase transmembrane domain-containing protein [Actinotalea fermentans]
MSSPPTERVASARSRVGSDHGVRIIDTPAVRVHHPADLMGSVLSLVGIAVVVVLSAYAHGTTRGIAEDVRGVADIVRNLVIFPIAVLEWIVTVAAPIAVLAELFWRRLIRQAAEAVLGAIVALLSARLAIWLIETWAITALQNEFSVWANGSWAVTIPPLLAAVAGMLTASGTRSRRRSAGWSWNFLWIVLGVAMITGLITLPGALLTVLIGRASGLALRYAFGVQSERAYGRALVEGIRRAGFAPTRLIRVRDVGADGNDTGELVTDLAAIAITRAGDNRVYAMTTADGERLDVVALDGDRQVVGFLTRLWRSMRLRGIEGRAVVSLRQAAERAALLSYAAWSAGVCTPRLLGMAEAEDSMLLIQQHARGAVPVRDLPPEALSDDVLDAVWEQLAIAHSAGLTHRAITSDVVLVNMRPNACPPDAPARTHHEPGAPVVLLTGWENGDVASSELARRIDVATLLTVLALKVGPERAVASAVRTIPDDLATIGPLLQPIAFPRATRDEARENRHMMGELREALLARLPKAVVEPERIVRFGARTILMIVLGIAAAFAVITSLNLEQVLDAVRQASPVWALVAFVLGLVTFVGSALAMVAFAPIKLSVWRTTLVQAAAAYLSLAAPAAVGPAALNMRMLTRRGVSNALSVASVGLVQLAQFVTTMLMLVGLSIATGTDQLGKSLPPRTILLAIAVIAVAAAALMLVPSARHWASERVVPIWQTTWPRLVQLIGQPRRFVVAIGGSLLMSLGYVGAFWASLAAFGQADRLSLVDIAIVYLLGNAVGAMVPVPGGLGTVETALSLALAGAGIPIAIATPTVLVFRAVTFWARIPIGWVAMRRLQRTGEL